MKCFSIFFLIRLFLGCLFLISGGEKLLSPYENFLYVVQGYDVVNFFGLDVIVAGIFPWIEFCLGGFIVLGLYLKASLVLAMLTNIGFICFVSQAIIRKLSLESCGCFGDLMKVPLQTILKMDILILILFIWVLCRLSLAKSCSLDQFLEDKYGK